MSASKQDVKAFITVANIFAEAIEEAGPGGIPSGHLYSMCMGLVPGLTLQSYTGIISLLVEAGRITNDGHLLRAKKA